LKEHIAECLDGIWTARDPELAFVETDIRRAIVHWFMSAVVYSSAALRSAWVRISEYLSEESIRTAQHPDTIEAGTQPKDRAT